MGYVPNCTILMPVKIRLQQLALKAIFITRRAGNIFSFQVYFRGEYQPAQKELHKALCACDLKPVIHSDQIFISDHVTRQKQNTMMSFPVLYNGT